MAFQQNTILVEDGITLPGTVPIESSAFSHSWKSVPDLDGTGLAAQLVKAGWTFFYMAGTIRRHAFGFDEGKRVTTAVGRIVKGVLPEKCNCVEITHLTTKAFLGIPYVRITAHARHIQNGSRLRGR